MAKRKRAFTEKKYEKWLKEGKGSGELTKYKPWLDIQATSSLGTSTRGFSPKTGRMFQLLSNLEKYYAYSLEFSSEVIDIREQYPLLYREDTMTIADKLNIEHPKDRSAQVYTVMTTDFLVIVKEGNKLIQKARTIKPTNQLSRRCIEKFEIERKFWANRNIEWKLVTDKDINVDYGMNLELLRDFHTLDNMVGLEQIDKENLEKLKLSLLMKIAEYDKNPIRSVLAEFDKSMHLDEGASIAIFNHLIYSKKIQIDLTKPLSLEMNTDETIKKVYIVKEDQLEWTYA